MAGTIGFMGAGQMATALAKGFLKAGVARADDLRARDVHAASEEKFRAETGATCVASVRELVEQSDTLFLCVKPQQMANVLDELKPLPLMEKLIVSIAAGVTLSTLQTSLGETARIVRVMPNTPALVGCGASAFALSPAATKDDARHVLELMNTVGLAVEVAEPLLDAVTGLSGSGPAYVYQVIEALSDGGVRMGLPRDTATRLAAQTVLGAAQMVLSTGQHPGALKDAVTSPGGTTIAGLHALELGGTRGLFMNAVQAATERSRELGKK